MTEVRGRVSFVIITHNRSTDLAECLRSCQSQEWPDKEIVVVDNKSTDDTLGMLAREFREVRVVALEENQGVSGGRNAGILEATGEICIQIDDDAVFVGTNVARRVSTYFESDDRLACVGFTILDAVSGEEETKSIPRRDKRSTASDYSASYFCGAGFAVRRRTFLDLDMFWAPLVYGSQEIDLSYRILDGGWRIVHSAEVEVLHKSVQTGRPSGQWVYYNTRDRPWVAVRNLPWRCVVTTTVSWWGNTLVASVRRGEIGSFVRGVWDCIVGLPSVIANRRVIGGPTARLLRELSGRYWY